MTDMRTECNSGKGTRTDSTEATFPSLLTRCLFLFLIVPAVVSAGHIKEIDPVLAYALMSIAGIIAIAGLFSLKNAGKKERANSFLTSIKNALNTGGSNMLPNLSRSMLLLIIAQIVLPVHAEEAESKPVLEVPKASEAPVIDGALNDAAWESAAVIDGLKPARGAKTEEAISQVPTTIRVLWDEGYLYVSFQCTDADIYVSGLLKRDENLYTEDVCEIFIDGKGDGRQYIETQVSPLNQTLDLMMLSTDEVDLNEAGMLKGPMIKRDWWSLREWNWKALKHASGRIVEDGAVVGWTVEMAIPAGPIVRRLGLKTFEPMELRANFLRYDWQPKETPEGEEPKRDLLHMNWSPVNGGCPHISPGGMGTLRLMPDTEKE